MAEGTEIIFKPLIGTDEATVDDKGRILIGKKKRERLGEPFAMAVGEVGCLVAYPEKVWQRTVKEIMDRDTLNNGRSQYSRLLLGNSDDELKFDQQGRVVVPQKLRDAAKLTDKVMLVGCGDRLEIWAKDEYERYLEDPEGYGAKRRESFERAYGRMVGQ